MGTGGGRGEGGVVKVKWVDGVGVKLKNRRVRVAVFSDDSVILSFKKLWHDHEGKPEIGVQRISLTGEAVGATIACLNELERRAAKRERTVAPGDEKE
jgi:hypothetical protein